MPSSNTNKPRCVSLVPSDTFSLIAIGGRDRLVGRTRYCVQPPDMQDIPVVGGTKDVDVEAVLSLRPDIVFANKEENAKQDIVHLQEAGVDVVLTFPTSVRETATHLRALAEPAGLTSDDRFRRAMERALALQQFASPERSDVPCWLPIWRNPWMTVNRETYLHSVLELLGLKNVFGDRPSRSRDGKDTRYPVVTRTQVEQRAPSLVLLPDEPYRFDQRHVDELSSWAIPAALGQGILLINGQDTCWHGAWALDGVPRLRSAIAERLSR